MKIRLFLLCLMISGLQGCARSATTPSLPPITYGTEESRAQAAIGNSTYIDQAKANATAAKAQGAGQ